MGNDLSISNNFLIQSSIVIDRNICSVGIQKHSLKSFILSILFHSEMNYFALYKSRDH